MLDIFFIISHLIVNQLNKILQSQKYMRRYNFYGIFYRFEFEMLDFWHKKNVTVEIRQQL